MRYLIINKIPYAAEKVKVPEQSIESISLYGLYREIWYDSTNYGRGKLPVTDKLLKLESERVSAGGDEFKNLYYKIKDKVAELDDKLVGICSAPLMPSLELGVSDFDYKRAQTQRFIDNYLTENDLNQYCIFDDSLFRFKYYAGSTDIRYSKWYNSYDAAFKVLVSLVGALNDKGDFVLEL